MEMNVYAVRDEVAGVFKYDFKRLRHGEALRYFGDAVQDGKSELSKHPTDFTLYFIATFNDETGRFTSLELPERLASANDFAPPSFDYSVPQRSPESVIRKIDEREASQCK